VVSIDGTSNQFGAYVRGFAVAVEYLFTTACLSCLVRIPTSLSSIVESLSKAANEINSPITVLASGLFRINHSRLHLIYGMS
jgi:hypothetical protein